MLSVRYHLQVCQTLTHLVNFFVLFSLRLDILDLILYIVEALLKLNLFTLVKFEGVNDLSEVVSHHLKGHRHLFCLVDQLYLVLTSKLVQKFHSMLLRDRVQEELH
jgi:hypothetical protein